MGQRWERIKEDGGERREKERDEDLEKKGDGEKERRDEAGRKQGVRKEMWN